MLLMGLDLNLFRLQEKYIGPCFFEKHLQGRKDKKFCGVFGVCADRKGKREEKMTLEAFQ